MGCLWDNSVSAAHLLASTDLDAPANRGPTRRVRGPGSGWGTRWTVEVLKCVCACEPREHCVCACTSDLLSLPDEGDVAACACFTWVLYVDAVEGMACLWQSVTSHVSVLCVSVRASGTQAQLHCWLNLQVGEQQLHPSAQGIHIPGTQVPEAGLQ